MESTYKYMKTDGQKDKTDIEIACRVEAKEYTRAANLADKSGNKELRDAICNVGLASYGKLADRMERHSIGGNPTTLAAIASVYGEMEKLCRIKGDAEAGKVYAGKRDVADKACISIMSVKRE